MKYRLIKTFLFFFPVRSINRQVEKHWYLIRDSHAILRSFLRSYTHARRDIRNNVSQSFIRSIFSPRERDIFVRVDVAPSLKKKDIDRGDLKKRRKQLYIFSLSRSHSTRRRTRNSSGGTHGRSPWNGSSLKENEFKVNNTFYSWVYFNDESLKNIAKEEIEEEEEEEEENAQDKFNSCTNIIRISSIHIVFVAHQSIFHQLS